MKTALVTGGTGQDASYLSELLIAQGGVVHLCKRRTSLDNTSRVAHIADKVTWHYLELTEQASVDRVVKAVKPDEVYNLGCMSHVGVSELCPAYTRATIYTGTFNLLNACSRLKNVPKFYQASSSEMFGNQPAPQHEGTPFAPISPYAEAKVDAHELCMKFRAKGFPVWCGILFNHESPRRGENFVTKKVTRALSRMACGLQDTCALGNIGARRDWGFAGDYVQAMHAMLQTDTPDDYVIATGESHSVREFLVKAVEETHRLTGRWLLERFVIDKALFRPHEVNHLEGDSRKAQQALGWEPKVRFEELVKLMVAHDLELARDELAVRQRREVAVA